MADAKRAVYKHLRLDGRAAGKCGNILPRKLARQHHSGKAKTGKHPRGVGAVTRHLRACVQGQVGECPPQRRSSAEVGYDKSVRTRKVSGLGGGKIIAQLAVVYQRVEGKIHPHSVFVTVPHGVPQLRSGKISRPGAGVEAGGAEIYRVCPRLHSGAQCLRRPGRGKQLGQTRAFRVFAHSAPFSPFDLPTPEAALPFSGSAALGGVRRSI